MLQQSSFIENASVNRWATGLTLFVANVPHVSEHFGCQPKPEPALALSSQCWVCSTVQPGTAKRVGSVTRWSGRPVTDCCLRKSIPDGLERCSVAASAETHKVINRPNAKTDRIALSPVGIAQVSSASIIGCHVRTDADVPSSRSVKSMRMKFYLMDAGELRTYIGCVIGDQPLIARSKESRHEKSLHSLRRPLR
jgi:hypothetical protein